MMKGFGLPTDAGLADLSYTDLHNHVIPGVDDGSDSLAESLEALREFRSEHVHRVVATPHLYLQFLDGRRELSNQMRFLREAFDELVASLPGAGEMPGLWFGQEVCAVDGASVRRVVDDAEVSLAGGPFMLVEFGFELPGDPDAVIRTVREAGREIVVAHPERYRYAAGVDPLEVMRRWVDAGAYLQVNLGSLQEGEGRYGSGVARLGWQMIGEGLAHLLSSDHHCRSRPQILHREIHRILVQRGGAAQAALLLSENPRRILEGRTPRDVQALVQRVGAGV